MDSVSNEYLRSAVLTAPPEQLHLMLYDGAIRFGREGITGIKQQNWEQAFNGFSRAQKIILEMLNSLKFDVDRELCAQMAGLYKFTYRKLVEACVERKVTAAEDALKILEYQRESWVMLIDKLRQERAEIAKSAAASGGDEASAAQASCCKLSVEG